MPTWTWSGCLREHRWGTQNPRCRQTESGSWHLNKETNIFRHLGDTLRCWFSWIYLNYSDNNLKECPFEMKSYDSFQLPVTSEVKLCKLALAGSSLPSHLVRYSLVAQFCQNYKVISPGRRGEISQLPTSNTFSDWAQTWGTRVGQPEGETRRGSSPSWCPSQSLPSRTLKNIMRQWTLVIIWSGYHADCPHTLVCPPWTQASWGHTDRNMMMMIVMMRMMRVTSPGPDTGHRRSLK